MLTPPPPPCSELLVMSTLSFNVKVDPLLDSFLRFTSDVTPADQVILAVPFRSVEIFTLDLRTDFS